MTPNPDHWQQRARWLKRVFIEANRDRRFAWGELRRENDQHVKAKLERDALRAWNARLDAEHAEQRLQLIGLRAVVDAAEIVAHHASAGTLGDHPQCVEQLRQALLGLDRSGVMGGSEGET